MKMAVTFPLTALLCLSGALLTTGTPVNSDHGCPEGWTLFGTRCFKFFDSKTTWIEAERRCQSHGANLASIHSAEEHNLITTLIRAATGEHRPTWIGGHDTVQEGQWMWTDGSVWNYSNWRHTTGEPNNHGGKEHFTEMSGGDTRWNDVLGTWTLDYCCAKDARPKVTLTVGGV